MSPTAHSVHDFKPVAGLVACVVLSLSLGACFFNPSPSKLNRMIEEGAAGKALEEINLQLTKSPSNPALNLLAAKAQLALCAKENCPETNPGKLSLVAELLEAGKGPVKLSDKEPPLTASSVVSYSIPLFAKLSPQPEALLVLYKTVPEEHKTDVLSALFLPALAHARNGDYSATAENLKALGHTADIPASAKAFALALAGMFEDAPADTESQIIGLRSLTGEIPPGAAALVPWALLAQTSVSETSTAAKSTLKNLPETLENWKLDNVLTDHTKSGLTHELNVIRTSDKLKEAWAKTFGENGNVLGLTLQRLSLSINPNQPEIWNIYLPTLIHSAASGTVPDLAEGLTFATISTTQLSSETQQQLAGQLLQAAGTLQQQPGMAAPLLVLAGSLDLTRQQRIDIDKLAQQIILKAANASDITATTLIARYKPEVALNNRQVVVPLLLANIRQSLRTQNFSRAVETANLLHHTLEMDVQLDPIILEEFADEMKRVNINTRLDAENADTLLQDAQTAELHLGPLFDFMQKYFEKQPKVITAQLTTLIANAHGSYGPANAMYRLGHLFPEEGMPAIKREEWLNQAITEAVSNDSHLSGSDIVTLTIKLTAIHPNLSPAPLLEAALSRTTSLEEYRSIWKSATAPMREILATIRPQFTSFMRGVDAYEAGHLNNAATSFSEITEPQWYNQAKSYFGKMQTILAEISGVYVPVSSLSSTRTGAIILSPMGLNGGSLQSVSVTFINRMGTLTQTNPGTYDSTPAAIRNISFAAPINLDARRIDLTEEVMDQLPDTGTFASLFGKVTSLKLNAGKEAKRGILQATIEDGKGNTSTLTLMRALVSPNSTLRPDGTYTIQSSLNKAVAGTETILPRGTILTIKTEAEPVPPPPTFLLKTKYVYPLTGTLNHPSTPQPIAFEGAFDPASFVFEFTFSYPLPNSKLPVKAQVRCQALAGPMICGAHHMHSQRQQFATLSAGMQTQESLATSAKARESMNTNDYKEMLAIAAEYQPPQLPVVEISLPLVSPTVSATALQPAIDTPATAATLLPAAPESSPTLVAPTTAVSTTGNVSTSTAAAAAGIIENEEEEEEELTSPSLPSTGQPAQPAKELTTITLAPGEKISDSIPAGVFIHKTKAKPASN